MRARRFAILWLVLSLVITSAYLNPTTRRAHAEAPSATFTVNTTDDTDDGTCNAAHCSLREAINAANANAGLDTISFNIAGTGVKTILPTTLLPATTSPVTIDGLTQPGASCASWPPTLLIELKGTGVAGSFNTGLEVDSDASIVRGLVINGWSGYGISIGGTGNKVECSFLGTNASGTAAVSNFIGVSVIAGGSNNIGGNVAGTRNLISGNLGDGVWLTNGVANNAVFGNYIGTDVTGNLDLGNGNNGVSFSNASNNTVGLPNPASRNVISGNNVAGIAFNNGSNNNSVVANYIGLNAAGTAAVGNSQVGVFINHGSSNFIGDTVSPTRNIISGNNGSGILIFGPSSNNFVRGNYFGTNPAGTAAIPNLDTGVRLASGTTLNQIGGNTDAARNLISGNGGTGVLVQESGTTNNSISRNYIGVTADGASALPNETLGMIIDNASGNLAYQNVISGNTDGGVSIVFQNADDNSIIDNLIGTAANGVDPLPNTGDGVRVFEGSSNDIGGVNPGDGNVIAYNTGSGVVIQTGTANQILGNSIYDNDSLGIDLENDGVTPNDPLDPDTGGNLLQNFPVLTSASFNGGVSIIGSFNTTPSTGLTIEVFGNASCDAAGNGEGRTFLGSLTTTSAPNGNVGFSTTFPVSPGGFWLTATATDSAGNTSEFGPCRALGCYADFNNNGRVDVQDITQVTARWNNPGAYNATYDVAPPFGSPIDTLDVAAIANLWNTNCP